MNQLPHLTCSDYYQHLMQPLADDAPCGEYLDYDPAFIMLLSRLQPKLGAEYGNFVEVAEPINWAETERECLALLQKSRDIRLIIILMRCRLRKVGVNALAEGIEALLSLLQTWPDDLYPQLLDEGEFAPMLRANAFAELEDINGLLADLRNQSLPRAAGLQITVKEFEKAHQLPREEGALSEMAVTALINEWNSSAKEGIQPLIEAHRFMQEIKVILDATLAHEAPELSVIRNILNLFARKSGNDAPTINPQLKAQHEGNIAAAAVNAALPAAFFDAPEMRKGVNNRADALQRLQEVRNWFATTEPGSPLIQVLKYAEESIGKNFIDLIKMYPPEIVAILNRERD